MREEDLKVKYMSNAGTGVTVSEEWRKRHEGRMQTVGVVRTQREKEKEETLIALREEKERKPRLEEKEKANSLGEGWEW